MRAKCLFSGISCRKLLLLKRAGTLCACTVSCVFASMHVFPYCPYGIGARATQFSTVVIFEQAPLRCCHQCARAFCANFTDAQLSSFSLAQKGIFSVRKFAMIQTQNVDLFGVDGSSRQSAGQSYQAASDPWDNNTTRQMDDPFDHHTVSLH